MGVRLLNLYKSCLIIVTVVTNTAFAQKKESKDSTRTKSHSGIAHWFARRSTSSNTTNTHGGQAGTVRGGFGTRGRGAGS
jgi:hypothetical protein